MPLRQGRAGGQEEGEEQQAEHPDGTQGCQLGSTTGAGSPGSQLGLTAGAHNWGWQAAVSSRVDDVAGTLM